MTPEEESKALVEAEFDLIEGQSQHFGWQCRLEDRGDFNVIYVRIEKPEGRTFVLRLECDDYARQAPLARFVNSVGWDEPGSNDDVEVAHYPSGNYMVTDRGPLPVMCIRGHRDYYAAGWHAGWTNPPDRQDTIYQLVVNVRRSILDLWS
jgi:hypothetical protein